MICHKPIKTHAPKGSSLHQAGAQPARGFKADDVIWSPYTAGPYLVPVTRWVE